MSAFSPPSQEQSLRIDIIDGLRGTAFLGILFHHIYGILIVPKPPLSTLLTNGSQGVSLFFVLSGFVLALPFVMGRRRIDTVDSVLSFILRRSKRLLPLYFVTLFFFATLKNYDTHPSDTLRNILTMGFMLFPFRSGFEEVPYYAGLWMLGSLFWYSMLLPVLFAFFRNFGIVKTILAMLGISSVARILALSSFPVWNRSAYFAMHTFMGDLSAFVLGIAVAVAFVRKPLLLRHWKTCLSASLALIVAGFIGMDLVIIEHIPVLTAALWQLVIALGFALLTISVLRSSDGWIVRKLLESRPLRLLGMMCYSLYMWHGMAVDPLGPSLNIYRLIRYLFLVFSVSWISYRYIEFGHVRNIRDLLPRSVER